jgi:hypothetical protein
VLPAGQTETKLRKQLMTAERVRAEASKFREEVARLELEAAANARIVAEAETQMAQRREEDTQIRQEYEKKLLEAQAQLCAMEVQQPSHARATPSTRTSLSNPHHAWPAFATQRNGSRILLP